MRRKMMAEPQCSTVRDVIADYSEKKMALVKEFQRREVWPSSVCNKFIESVSEGTAVSSIIVADIETGMEASEALGDIVGLEKYQKLWDDGKRTVNEDGQNRLRKALIRFVDNEITFSGILYDLNHEPKEFVNVKFEKLPESFQHAFLNSHVVVVTIKNAPFRKLPDIFRKLNSGCALTRMEIRQSLQTPISGWLRKHSEGTFKEMWPRIQGCTEQKILRMQDIEWLTQLVMALNPHTNNKDLKDPDMDWFYEIGENRPMNSVNEYDASELLRATSIMETVKTTIELQEYTPPSKSIPKRTFWALVLAAEYLYDNNTKYKINSHGQFYKDVYRLDAQLETSSSAQQHIDIQTAKNNSANAHMDEDEIKAAFAPDKNYYWSNCRYMTDSKPRTNRKNVLIDEIVKGIKSGEISSIVPPAISTSAVAK